jgi:hypothetical protein
LDVSFFLQAEKKLEPLFLLKKKNWSQFCRPWTLGQGLVATSWRCSYYFYINYFLSENSLLILKTNQPFQETAARPFSKAGKKKLKYLIIKHINIIL